MAKDRTRYFRVEARELLDALARGLAELGRAPADRAAVARLLRAAHTLKGAARVVGERTVGELAHEAEDALARHRAEDAPEVPRETVEALLALVDRMSEAVAALEPVAVAGARAPATGAPAAGAPQAATGERGAAADAPGPRAGAPAAASSPGAEAFESVRVDLREMDALLASALEAGVQVTALRRGLGRLERAHELARALGEGVSGPRAQGDGAEALQRLRPLVEELRRELDATGRALAARADGAEREVALVRSAADRARLLPARAIFGVLARAARDAARSLGREVEVRTSGGEVRVEANVLSGVRDALLHAVRNAVVHGGEEAPAREAAGKGRALLVRIEVERRGRRVAFRCADDGRGLDPEAVRAAAERQGRLGPGARPLDPEAAAALLLRGGLSTRTEVDQLAGRGVGLDVVRETAARLRAEVALRSEPGRGTSLVLEVPVSLSAVGALHLQAEGATVSLPVAAVRRTLFVPSSSVVRTPHGQAIDDEGALVPFAPLAAILGRAPAQPRARRAWSAVVVEAEGRRAAIGADRVLGTSDVVVRPLPDFLEASAAVAGASLDAEGHPQLLLDPAGVVAAAAGLGVERAAPPQARPPILVIDDSLTTRMLEQSILESAGYEVALATSAEEALQRARERRYGVFVVDVEMPGMDGFEFVRTTRADPRLAGTPAILVTSRGAPEDRARGAEAGAAAYIVKGEFDQGRLLATIAELLR